MHIYGYSLLLASRQHIDPVLNAIPAVLSLQQVAQLDLVHENVQVLVDELFLSHVVRRVRVDDLVAERAHCHVGFLFLLLFASITKY